MTARHPIQPVVLDAVGTARFKENAIVRHLVNHGGLDLNHLHTLDFTDSDWEQFVQLIGYSVGGTVNMDYMSDEVWEAAQAAAETLIGTPAPVPRPLNGCHNKPRPTAESTYPAQDGYIDAVKSAGGEPTRLPRVVQVPHRMSTTCQYDKSATDAGCAGCQHGEERA